MRENETLPAVVAFLAGLLILTGALGGFLLFVGDGSAGAPAADKPDCLSVSACAEASADFASAYNDPAACEGEGRRVCLVPLGTLPKDLVDHLVAYYDREYDLTLHVLPTVSLTGQEWSRPGQMAAEHLRRLYQRAYPDLYRDPEVMLISLTYLDIYTLDEEWGWFFGQASRHDAVVSAFRMDPENWRERRDDDLRNKRVRTLMNKYVAFGYYKLDLNDNRRSVLYRLIGSLDTLDGIDERIPVADAPTPTPTRVPPTPAPTATLGPARSQAEEIGREIADVYIELMTATRAVVEPRPAAGVVESKLVQLRDSYSPRFEALGCLTDAMTVAQRQETFSAAEQYYDVNSDDDLEWHEKALDFYSAASGAGVLLSAINGLLEYALPELGGEPRRFQTPC